MEQQLNSSTGGWIGDDRRDEADFLSDVSIEQNQILVEGQLPMEAILRDAVRRKATYQVQYADYDLTTWSISVELTQNRMDKLLDDVSIRKVRLELDM